MVKANERARALTLAFGLAMATPAMAQGPVTSAVSVDAPDGSAGPATPEKVDADLAFAPAASQQLQVKAAVDVEAGDRADPAVSWVGAAAPGPLDTPWSRLDANLKAQWASADATTAQASVERSLEVQDLPPRSDGSPAQDRRDAETVDLAVGVTPAHGLQLSASGRVAGSLEAIDSTDTAIGPLQMRTGETTGDASLQWSPTRLLRLEADDRLGYGEASLRQSGVTDQGYAVVEPQVGAVLTPWRGAQWRLSFGHAVSPLDLGAFATVAESLQRTADGGTAAALQPNQEWRTQARFSQALPGAGSLGLTLTSAQLDSTQELTRNIDGTDVAGSITGGQRRQLDLALAMPLGMGGLSLKTDASARDSAILDPVTGTERRLSGEAPYDASLTLTQDVAPLDLRWGVQAAAQGQQIYYTPEEASTAAQARTFGMFVEYHPQPFALRLQVDGLSGAERDITDVYYDDTRESDRIARIDHRLDGGPAVSLVLRKAL